MITKEDVKALNIYFKSLETIPEDLITIEVFTIFL